MTVGELERRMSSRELTEWMAFASVEPFGEERADIREAQTASLIANVNRSKGRSPYRLDEFLPYKDVWEPETIEDDVEDAEPDPVDQNRLAQKIKATMFGLGKKR